MLDAPQEQVHTEPGRADAAGVADAFSPPSDRRYRCQVTLGEGTLPLGLELVLPLLELREHCRVRIAPHYAFAQIGLFVLLPRYPSLLIPLFSSTPMFYLSPPQVLSTFLQNDLRKQTPPVFAGGSPIPHSDCAQKFRKVLPGTFFNFYVSRSNLYNSLGKN